MKFSRFLILSVLVAVTLSLGSVYAAVDQNGYVCYVTTSDRTFSGQGATPSTALEQAVNACGSDCYTDSYSNSNYTSYCE